MGRGQIQGAGEVTYPDGSFYAGNFVNGLASGTGKFNIQMALCTRRVEGWGYRGYRPRSVFKWGRL